MFSRSNILATTKRKLFSAQRHCCRAGAALLLVLGFVVLLSFLTAGILKNSRREMVWQASESSRPQLEIAARSALEATLAVIANFQSIDGAIYCPRQGWADALTLAGFEYVAKEDAWRFDDKTLIDVKFRDESGRYALNKLSSSDLATLLVALGVSTSDTDALCACFADWIDSDDNASVNGAEIDDYDSDDENDAIPPNRELRDFSEIRYIKNFPEIFLDDNGNPNELYRLLENAVSLVAESSRPNINTATPAALKALVYESGTDADAVTDYLEATNSISGTPNVFRNASDLSRASADGLANKVSFGVQTLRITTTARRGAASFTLDTLVSVSTTTAGSTSSPFKILEQTSNVIPE
ncbi:MAG: general secretion pathway protein GspK [Opitutae bacterium]|nr:general secretion pathway protein GspK [Opitutae bacterium]MCD8298843.1 general secretion pathway protein GspK [Opitutae bacterium]